MGGVVNGKLPDGIRHSFAVSLCLYYVWMSVWSRYGHPDATRLCMSQPGSHWLTDSETRSRPAARLPAERSGRVWIYYIRFRCPTALGHISGSRTRLPIRYWGIVTTHSIGGCNVGGTRGTLWSNASFYTTSCTISDSMSATGYSARHIMGGDEMPQSNRGKSLRTYSPA